jgi:hypothetical protein
MVFSSFTSSLLCRLGIASLALAWVSAGLLVVLVIFLIIWSIIHRSGHGEHSIYKSNIKAHYVEGEFETLGKPGMSSVAPGSHPSSTSHPATPVAAHV